MSPPWHFWAVIPRPPSCSAVCPAQGPGPSCLFSLGLRLPLLGGEGTWVGQSWASSKKSPGKKDQQFDSG